MSSSYCLLFNVGHNFVACYKRENSLGFHIEITFNNKPIYYTMVLVLRLFICLINRILTCSHVKYRVALFVL
jgi:hypothetical protein